MWGIWQKGSKLFLLETSKK